MFFFIVVISSQAGKSYWNSFHERLRFLQTKFFLKKVKKKKY